MLHPTQKAHTNPCNGVRGGSRCPNEAMEGSDFCPACGGPPQLKAREQKSLSGYMLAKYQARMSDFADSDGIKSLKDEIGILRILMEERLNQIQTPLDLLTHTHTISDLATKIEKLVSSCQRLDKLTGQFLDKSQVVQLGLEILTIITKHVDDQKAIDNITEDLLSLITNS